MNIIIPALVAMGIPAAIIYGTICTSGLRGYAILTHTLSSLSPDGIMVGVLLLLAIQFISFLLAKSVIEWIYDRVLHRLIKDGYPDEDIIMTISKYHVTRTMKRCLVHKLAVQSVIEVFKNEIKLYEGSKESIIQRDID